MVAVILIAILSLQVGFSEIFLDFSSNFKFIPHDQDELNQIERDQRFGLQLFDEINMTDPIEKVPVFFSDNGINSAAHSLRYINRLIKW